MTRQLRDYQLEGVLKVYGEWEQGRNRTSLVMATGLGKTDIIASVATTGARPENARVLVLAHRDELLNQITERCQMHAPEIPVGRVQGSQNIIRRPITVASSSTLARAKRRAKMLRPTLVVVDECHHAASPSYMEILKWAGCFDEHNPTPLMGVTATMTRGDKRGLGDVFQSVAFSRDTVWAIENGWLVRPHGRVVIGEHMDLESAKVSRGDFQDGELGEMVAQDVDQIVKAWLEHASERITVAFTPDVSSACQLAEEFRAQGVPTGEVYGDTPHQERRRIYDDLGRGELRVLVSVMVTTEGWDCPPVSCVLMARPTKLRGLYQQIVGRGLRLSPETGKTDCLVLDVVGASRTQKLATLVDLLPSAEYDDTEIEVLPCPTCGGYLGRAPAVVALATERGMTPCECACIACEAAPCECEPEPAPRDPDGGRRRLKSPARYAEVDLLGLGAPADGEAGGSQLNWLTTHGGVVFLAAENRIGVLHQDKRTGDWSAAHVASYGAKDAVVLVEDVPLQLARVTVERWAQGLGVYTRDAAWRTARARATEGQQRTAARLGIESPEEYTKGAISDAIDIERASRQLDR